MLLREDPYAFIPPGVPGPRKARRPRRPKAKAP